MILHNALLQLSFFGFFIIAVHADDLEKESLPMPQVPDDLIGDPYIRQELGVNQFTAPSIKRIFDDLDQLAPLSTEAISHDISSRMPLNRTDLALEIGFYIADGFIAVQSGQMDKIQVLAEAMQRYGRALGAGERVNRHAASLLDSANKNDIVALKDELTATQRDVETDLIHLRDIDLAHLISLGGWIRALEVGSHAVDTKFTSERAIHLYRPDIARYYKDSLDAIDPRISERSDIKGLRELIAQLENIMTLKKGQAPQLGDIKNLAKTSRALAKLALTRKTN